MLCRLCILDLCFFGQASYLLISYKLVLLILTGAINKMYRGVAVRMWSLTSIDPDVQAEQAGLESASASTREERRTSSATWKTKQYVSFWFR